MNTEWTEADARRLPFATVPFLFLIAGILLFMTLSRVTYEFWHQHALLLINGYGLLAIAGLITTFVVHRKLRQTWDRRLWEMGGANLLVAMSTAMMLTAFGTLPHLFLEYPCVVAFAFYTLHESRAHTEWRRRGMALTGVFIACGLAIPPLLMRF